MPKDIFVNEVVEVEGQQALGFVVTGEEILNNILTIFDSTDQEAIKKKMGDDFENISRYCQFLVFTKFTKEPFQIAMQFTDVRIYPNIQAMFEKITGLKLTELSKGMIPNICIAINSDTNLQVAKLVKTISLQDLAGSELN